LKKAEDLLVLAKLQKDRLGNSTKALKLTKEATTFQPNWGEPYILLGLIHASSGRLFDSKSFDRKAIIWAAIDMWNIALKDPETSDEAKRLIEKYTRYQPTKADCFMRNLQLGDRYTIDCIGYTTTVRYKQSE